MSIGIVVHDVDVIVQRGDRLLEVEAKRSRQVTLTSVLSSAAMARRLSAERAAGAAAGSMSPSSPLAGTCRTSLSTCASSSVSRFLTSASSLLAVPSSPV